MGSGIQAQFHTNLQKPDAGHFNAGGRWTAKSLQELFGEFFFDDTGAVGGVGRIIGGLRWTIPALTIQVDLTKGAIAWQHVPATSGLTAVVNGTETVPTTLLALIGAISGVAIADNVSGSERIDVIVADWTLITDRQLSMPQKIPTGPINQNTRWSASAAVVVVQGTPGAGQPAIGVNQQALFQVVVPDGTTSANFDVNARVRELSTPATMGRLGPGSANGYQVGVFDDGSEVPVLQSLSPDDGAITLRHRHQDASSPDLNNDHYPRWRRPAAMPVGESALDLFPLVNPGGREWTRVYGLDSLLLSGEVPGDTISTQIGYSLADTRWVGTSVVHVSANADTAQLSQALIGDVRGLQVIGARLSYTVATQLNSGNHTVQLFRHDAGTGLAVAESNDVVMSNALGGHNLALTGITANLVLDDPDEFLFLVITVNHPASGDVAFYTIGSMALDFREARS
jgi:hypothetical protein